MKITANKYMTVRNYCRVWKTLKEISEFLGVGETTTRRMLINMEDRGILLKIKSNGKGLTYKYISSPHSTDEAVMQCFKRRKRVMPKKVETKEVKVKEKPTSYITKVNSNDYHTRIERARPRVYVASTANMI